MLQNLSLPPFSKQKQAMKYQLIDVNQQTEEM